MRISLQEFEKLVKLGRRHSKILSKKLLRILDRR